MPKVMWARLKPYHPALQPKQKYLLVPMDLLFKAGVFKKIPAGLGKYLLAQTDNDKPTGRPIFDVMTREEAEAAVEAEKQARRRARELAQDEEDAVYGHKSSIEQEQDQWASLKAEMKQLQHGTPARTEEPPPRPKTVEEVLAEEDAEPSLELAADLPQPRQESDLLLDIPQSVKDRGYGEERFKDFIDKESSDQFASDMADAFADSFEDEEDEEDVETGLEE